MQLETYVERLQSQIATSVELGGEEVRRLAESLIAPLDSTFRLVLLEALSDAAGEITLELAPGSVEVRLRSGDPEFVVVPPPVEDDYDTRAPSRQSIETSEEGSTARLNLRLPESLKERIHEAASNEGLSLNAWLIRSASSALDGTRASGLRSRGGDSFTGWVR